MRCSATIERSVNDLTYAKTHIATALGLAICRLGRRVKFVTAASLVTQLEEAQQQHRLERVMSQLERLDLLIIDELGYLSFSRGGAELLFQAKEIAMKFEGTVANGVIVPDGPPPPQTETYEEHLANLRQSVQDAKDGLGRPLDEVMAEIAKEFNFPPVKRG